MYKIYGVTPGFIALVFVVLKLCNVINWSWWWILSPIWIGVGVSILALVIWLLAIFIAKRMNQD